MSWIPKKNAASPVPATVNVRTLGHSLEQPIVMSVRRLPAPVYATLIEINAHGARIRSLVLMDRGAEIEFDLELPGTAPITIAARVEHRRNAASGARFEYQISFALMTESQIDVLARAVRELERRAAASRTIAQSIDAMPTTDSNRRGSYRALAAFPVRYRREGDQWAEGRVIDISATGLRITTTEVIAIGTQLDIRFRLPSDVLDVYPEETLVLDVSQNAPRQLPGRPDMRRPFEEMALRGRIVTGFQPIRERPVYGLAFVEIDGYQREEIARFTHALQLSKIRGK